MGVTEQYGIRALLLAALLQLPQPTLDFIAIPVHQQYPFFTAFPEQFPWAGGCEIAIPGNPDDVDVKYVGEQVRIIFAVTQVNYGIDRCSKLRGSQREGIIIVGI